jgi:hypothetical protein
MVKNAITKGHFAVRLSNCALTIVSKSDIEKGEIDMRLKKSIMVFVSNVIKKFTQTFLERKTNTSTQEYSPEEIQNQKFLRGEPIFIHIPNQYLESESLTRKFRTIQYKRFNALLRVSSPTQNYVTKIIKGKNLLLVKVINNAHIRNKSN